MERTFTEDHSLDRCGRFVPHLLGNFSKAPSCRCTRSFARIFLTARGRHARWCRGRGHVARHGAGKPMQVPSILQGQRPFDLIKGGITGAILITAVGFNWAGYGFGWTLRSTAEQKAKDAEEAAIVRVLAPICADKFRQASDSVANVSFPRVGTFQSCFFIKDTGYATFPGSEYDRKVAETCVELLTQVK